MSEDLGLTIYIGVTIILLVVSGAAMAYDSSSRYGHHLDFYSHSSAVVTISIVIWSVMTGVYFVITS